MSGPDPYLADLVRKADPERYLSTLYAPADRRTALLALHAFDAEIARVRDVVSEPIPGEIRLQWWRDVLSAADPEAGAGHPVAGPLLEAVRTHRLPIETFLACLDAHTFDLYDDPMPSRVDLEGYCGETTSAFLQLAAIVLDPAAATAHADLAGHGGCALGLARIVRLMPLHRSRGQCYVPAGMLAATGLDRDAFLSGANAPAMAAMVEAMTALARDHLVSFLRGATSMPQALRPAFLQLATLPARLARIDPSRAWCEPAGDISFLHRHWLLFRHASRGWRPL